VFGKKSSKISKMYSKAVNGAFMAYHLVCNNNSMMVDISGTGTAHSSGAHVFIPSFIGVPNN
jgi:hypothetical protein